MINQDQTCEEHLEILNAALSDNWNTAADALQHHLELARDKPRESSRSSGCGK